MSTPNKIVHNVPADGVPYFTPAQIPPAGTATDPQPNGTPIPKLFQPLKIRGVEFQNRIFLSPLCQYSADNGHLTMWHQGHLGGIFTRGPGLTVIEATAVLPEGRITPEDSGLWQDSQIGPLKEIVDFAHSQGQKIGIQLAHAGRKASTVAPWLDMGLVAVKEAGGWPDDVWGPGTEPWNERFPVPKALTKEGIKRIVEAYAAAAKRVLQAGFDVIELHNAHGYLGHSFLSPAINKRTDEYGGSFENRTRLSLEVLDAVRAVVPESMPIFFRVSGTDWLQEALPNEPSWTQEETIKLAHVLAQRGVDLLDVSSGGNHPLQRIPHNVPTPQADIARAIKASVGASLLVSAVGSINDGKTAQRILSGDEGVDVAFVGRQFQKNPGTVWAFAEDLGVDSQLANQIKWGFKGRGSGKVKAKA